jgi:ATP-dependent exoDNAse (exonuclease V) alpha subunit
MAQLPPIPDAIIGANGLPVMEVKRGRNQEKKEDTPWAFKSSQWEKFQKEIVRLTKIWRQSEGSFLDGLMAIRKGVGTMGAGYLKDAGVTFVPNKIPNFDGTTIVATNDEVDNFNQRTLDQLPGKSVYCTSFRWSAKAREDGSEYLPSEWNNIPKRMELKKGCLVMILSNDTENWEYVNGDLGHVEEIYLDNENLVRSVLVKLLRTGAVVDISKIARRIEQDGAPEKAEKDRHPELVRKEKIYSKEKWILGECKYLPVRVAYASTVHKCQGLTLDRVQMDPSAWQFGKPGMVYVGVSRCRTPQGLFIVGDVGSLAKQVKADPVLREKGFL